MVEPAPSLGLRRNTLYSTAGMLVRLGVSVAAGPLLIRGLGLERYGLWVVLVSWVGIALVAQLGLDSALTFFLSAAQARSDPSQMGQVAGTALALFTGLGLLATILFGLFVPWWVGRSLAADAPEALLPAALRVFSLTLLPRFWQGWAVASEGGLLRYDVQAQIESLSVVFLNLGLIGLAWMGQGLFALALWLLFATLAGVLAHLLFLRRAWKQLAVRLGFRRELAGQLLRFGLAQWLSSLGGLLFSQVDRLLVNAFLGPAAVGLYAAATSVTARINELSSVPIQSIAPAMSAAVASGQKTSVPHLFRRALRLNALIVYLFSAALLLWAQPLAVLLVSAEHAAPVAALLRLLVPIYALYSLNAPGYYAAMGLRRPELNAAGALLGGVATLLLMVGLIPAWGLMGAAWGNSGYILVGTINLGAARLTGLGVRKWLAEALPFAIGLLLLGGLVWVSGLLGAGSYLLVLFASLLALVPAWWIDRQSLVDLAHLPRRWIQRRRLVE